MHKKFFVLVVAIALVTVGMGFGQQTQTFNLSAEVHKYIEVNPAYGVVNKLRDVYLPYDGTPPGLPNYAWSRSDVVYANCPFTISYVGHNAVDDGLPILARQEVNGNGYDRLQTGIVVRHFINEVGNGFERHDTSFLSDPDGAATGKWLTGPFSNGTPDVSFTNTPHDGEVRVELRFSATPPHKSPDFGVDNTWNQSADAGLYTCTLVATYAVI